MCPSILVYIHRDLSYGCSNRILGKYVSAIHARSIPNTEPQSQCDTWQSDKQSDDIWNN